jgi:predicted nuclease of predicted toxin-antitoxin system
LADESVDRQIVHALRAVGFDVDAIAEDSPGMADDGVLELARLHQAILLTADKDFGELVYRLRLIHHGVILLRMAGVDATQKATDVVRAVQAHQDRLPNAFCVISPGMIRIRPESP